MKRINIYIGEDQHKKLIALVKKKGRSGYSEFVRTAIDRYLDKTAHAGGKQYRHEYKN